MRIAFFICLVLAVFTVACNQNPSAGKKLYSKTLPNDSAVSPASPDQTHLAASQECKSGTSLLFEDEGLSSFTEDSIRGAGVVSFQLEINDRLDIYNIDGTAFGNFVLNEDGTYYTLDMPQKTTARRFIPAQGFAAFDFDAEPDDADQDYLLIYVNKKKRKVKKAGLKYTYHTWSEYLRDNTIRLNPCNPLKAANGTIIKKSLDQAFEITAVKGDLIEIKSIKECQTDGPYLDMRGSVKWRTAGGLIINFAVCD